MGLGSTTLGLYVELLRMGEFDGIQRVVELGSQTVWCRDRALFETLFSEFDRPAPSEEDVTAYVSAQPSTTGSSRHLHELLGFEYDSIDIDGNLGAQKLDLNFDEVPNEMKGKYCLTTNNGTTEHAFNQYNSFKFIHDLTRPGGLILHFVPFIFIEHGFFNYQPNIFTAIAKYNSYETLGIWLSLDSMIKSLIPWEHNLLDFLTLTPQSTHCLFVVQKKMYDAEFKVPLQSVYEAGIPEEAAKRYDIVVDGEYLSASRVSHLTRLASTPAEHATPRPAAPDDFPARVLLSNLYHRAKRRLKTSASKTFRR